MIKNMTIILCVMLLISCISEPKKNTNKTTKKETVAKVKIQSKTNKKGKVGKNTYEEALKRTNDFANNLNFDMEYIRNKGLGEKKFLAEYIGLFSKLYKVASEEEKLKIKQKIKPFYEETLKAKYHNMAKVDDKLFKKNSMSYMRILWLLNELDFDTSFYRKELVKVQKRMDDHMSKRGEWQKAVFEKYYTFFKIEKPTLIKYANKFKGPITYRRPLSFYDRTKAYNLTHFVFVAYDYGNKITQTRFSKKDIDYLATILPQLIANFEAKGNDDIVGELLTCLVLVDKTATASFKKSYQRLLNRQNNDGSFGSYERLRKKYKNDVEFRAYLHTTLVDIELFIEYDFRH